VNAPRLPRRLRTVLDLLPDGAARVADVGAGHGALSAHLSEDGRVVIATESQDGPFAELCRNLDGWNARASVDTRRGAALQPLQRGEVDAVVVAGVSAHTALSICQEAREKRVRWVVLQCVQGVSQVEPWLAAQGWPVLSRVDAVDRRRTYPTWLVGVPE
jgi:tRNA (adenine22-N1)-methyltransferase